MAATSTLLRKMVNRTIMEIREEMEAISTRMVVDLIITGIIKMEEMTE